MKKYRIIILILIVILLTGCSGSYKVSIKEDLSVKEELKTNIKKENENYDRTLKLFEENKVPEDNYKIVLDDKNIKITYKSEYDSIEDYLLNSRIYKIMYDNVYYNNDKNKKSINTYSPIKLDKTYSTLSVNDMNMSNFMIEINTPLNISKQNADKVSKNKYIWNYNKKTHDKNIKFEIDLSKRADDYKYLIIISSMIILVLIVAVYIFKKFRNTQKF